jgi:hypothetical protein
MFCVPEQAIAENSADSGVLVSAHGLIGVIGRVHDMAMIRDRGDPAGEGLQASDEISEVDIVRPIKRRKNRTHSDRIVAKRPIDRHGAKLRLPHMTMRIDDARKNDHIRGVDDFAVVGLNLGRDCGNGLSVDEDIALAQVADPRIHRENRAASDQNPPITHR